MGDREGRKGEERVKRGGRGAGDGDRAGCTYAARLMHRTGSSNGRVGHEYLINNYYRETLYFCEEREKAEEASPLVLPLFGHRLLPLPPGEAPGPPVPLSYSLSFSSLCFTSRTPYLPPSLPDVHRAAIFAYL